MVYIGNSSAANFASVTKDTFDGNASSYTLSKPATTNGVAVYVENVRQIPTTAYTVSGTTLDFGSGNAPPTGTNNIYVMHHNTPVSTATHPASQALTATSGTFTSDVTGTTATFNKASSGDVLDLKLSGTSIGNIGVISDRVYLTAEGSHGVYLDASADNFCPSSTTGTDNDGNIDLGASFARWKDGYFSGGVHLGGTGSANKLEDYEEGTFTPAFTNFSGSATFSNAVYVKIGQMVFYTLHITGKSNTSDGDQITISGFPFSALGEHPASIGTNSSSSTPLGHGMINTAEYLYLYTQTGGAYTYDNLAHTSGYIRVQGAYRTA